MGLIAQLMRHLMFTMVADVVRNPEKYRYHAWKAAQRADYEMDKVKQKAKEKYEDFKSKRKTEDPMD
jgi:hypothetical protein